MGPTPRITLCIPTNSDRTRFLKVALASAIQEALAYPAGTVEVLVSDNGSAEATRVLLGQFQAQYPWLRLTGFPENRGFDENYVHCFQEARGEFVWVMGDDDMFLPGCLAPVLAAVDAGADAILCAAYECDFQMKPLQPRGWFKRPDAPAVWHLDDRQALAEYLRGLQYQAGAFAFISAAIIRRQRFLEGLPVIQQGMGQRYIHVLGMLAFLAAPTCLHWIAKPLFLNRLDNDWLAREHPWERLNMDLDAWIRFADICYPEHDELRAAFMGVLRSNHQDHMVKSLRILAGSDRQRWMGARRKLLEVGYDPVLVSSVGLAYAVCNLEVAPPGHLDANGLCLADLGLVTRGARRIAVLADAVLGDFLAGTALLEALRAAVPGAVIRVVCAPDLAPLVTGFDLQILDRDRLLKEDPYMERQTAALRDFAPDLVVNLDRLRRIAGDLLCEAARPAGSLGFDDETPENRDDLTHLRRRRLYRRLLPKDAPGRALAEALGIQPGSGRLWLDPDCLGKARGLLEEAGWDPCRTLCVLADDPEALAGACKGSLERAQSGGWTAIGLGGPGTAPLLDQALRPFGGRARNLGGTLDLAHMAAHLQVCVAFTGGSSLFQALAEAAGCAPFGPEPS